MKYGLLFHKTSTNFGDDIQSYAISRFLPHIDYYIAREQIDSFTSENNEPVAVIMAAWWMWKKWNWPPAECIIPKLTSMHFNNYSVRQRSTPMKNEWLTGIGKDFFDAYGPVGARDETSLEILQKCGIDAYLSGCITLTLPEQETSEDKGKYVVLVDLKPEIKEKVLTWLDGSGLEIREFSHSIKCEGNGENYEERLQRVEDVLTLYQNAKFVVTQRLHVTLPCIAMNVPVFSIIDLTTKRNKTRWYPYCEWVNFMTEEEILTGDICFDNTSLAPNKQEYLQIRNDLIADIQAFISNMELLDDTTTLEELKKTDYTENEAKQWQYNQMKRVLDKW
ncbi:MAG: polysaccharide pyruvyl transferase family protein, partial [Lachnospiraceae bacterium]|nr:polysaccharide pyruvyl transferase family protein [Lachnospiraceae bacterium]